MAVAIVFVFFDVDVAVFLYRLFSPSLFSFFLHGPQASAVSSPSLKLISTSSLSLSLSLSMFYRSFSLSICLFPSLSFVRFLAVSIRLPAPHNPIYFGSLLFELLVLHKDLQSSGMDMDGATTADE